MPYAPMTPWGHCEVARGQKGFPEPGMEVAAKGQHLPDSTRADPAAAAGEKTWELLKSIS